MGRDQTGPSGHTKKEYRQRWALRKIIGQPEHEGQAVFVSLQATKVFNINLDVCVRTPGEGILLPSFHWRSHF